MITFMDLMSVVFGMGCIWCIRQIYRDCMATIKDMEGSL